jgi:hypothetical protein
MKVLTLTLLIVFSNFSIAQKADDLASFLQRKDQALADAIAPGERKVWEDAISPDFFYADENNVVMDGAEFPREFVPLPKGASGHIVVGRYESHRNGDTVIVVYRDDETENYFGSELHAQ